LALRLRAGGIFDVKSLDQGEQRFIPVQERLFAGGPTSVRGFRPNELGPASYRVLGFDTVLVNGVKTLQAKPGNGEITVPVGGTAMVVGNIEYRVRAPVLSNLAQLAIFTDVGQVWNHGVDSLNLGLGAFKWTPGVGLRVVTAFGAIRLDVGYNGYQRVAGPAYFDTPLVSSSGQQGGLLYCVSPGNTIPIPPPAITPACQATYQPLRPASFWRRLTPSISIGQAF
jgi:outer membrane protein insertion porin family/translocation and assembly module TamA